MHNPDEDRIIEQAELGIKLDRLRKLNDDAYLAMSSGERSVLRLRFADDPKRLARFDELDKEPS